MGGVADILFGLLGLACLAYVCYCVKKGRSMSTIGWIIREESPKLFWFHLSTLIVFGLGGVVASILFLTGLIK